MGMWTVTSSFIFPVERILQIGYLKFIMQEGSLCAQHCLNTLLQGQYFSPVDLASIAQQLDESERMQMAEGGMQTAEYQRFIQQASNNFDDSGFFSIQVIDKALQVWGLNLVQFNSQDAIARNARQNPVLQNAYICNFRDHWFTVRKLGCQWFNLNSLLTGPELISDTYLSLFLTQLQQEGYSIFIVTGRLPECEADEVLRLAPAVQPVKPRLINENQAISKTEEPEEVDQELQTALEQSRQLVDGDDKMLQQALQMSMEGYVIEPEEENSVSASTSTRGPSKTTAPVAPPQQPTKEELRLKRLAFLSQVEKSSKADCDNKAESKTESESKTEPDSEGASQSAANTGRKSKDAMQKCEETTHSDAAENNAKAAAKGTEEDTTSKEMTEEEMLKQAIEMSMEGGQEG